MSLYILETQLELQVHEFYDAYVLQNCNIYLITISKKKFQLGISNVDIGSTFYYCIIESCICLSFLSQVALYIFIENVHNMKIGQHQLNKPQDFILLGPIYLISKYYDNAYGQPILNLTSSLFIIYWSFQEDRNLRMQ